MCYNVLCDRYATRQMYGYCPQWALNWEYRKKGILDEVRHYRWAECMFNKKQSMRNTCQFCVILLLENNKPLIKWGAVEDRNTLKGARVEKRKKKRNEENFSSQWDRGRHDPTHRLKLTSVLLLGEVTLILQIDSFSMSWMAIHLKKPLENMLGRTIFMLMHDEL